jgi:hypothetical protein
MEVEGETAVAVVMEGVMVAVTGATTVKGTGRSSLIDKRRRTVTPIIMGRLLVILETIPMKNQPWTNTKTLPRITNLRLPMNQREKRRRLIFQPIPKNRSRKLPIDCRNLERGRRLRRANRQ